MSTILDSLSRFAFHRGSLVKTGASTVRATPSRAGVRGLTVMLLAAVVSTLVLFADQYVGVWTDGHLFFGWVVLWAMVFASMALFAGSARSLATRFMAVLDGWSHSLAQSRAEARMWEIAQSDPRIMAELTQARMRDVTEDTTFEMALAPMGMEPEVKDLAPATSGWGRFPERLAASRARNIHLYYI